MSDKQFKPDLMDIKGKPFLGAHDAITWFRRDFPLPRSQVVVYIEDIENSIVRCEISVDGILISTADVRGDGQKSIEKLETAAVRRALAYAGYGTVAAIAQEDDDRTLDEAGDAQVAMIVAGTSKEERREMMNGKKKKHVGKATKTPKLKVHWANDKSVKVLFEKYRELGLTDTDIIRFAGVQKWNDFAGWNTHESAQMADDIISIAFDDAIAETGGLPPSNPDDIAF